ncbi:MAG: hypothetical protein M3Q34_01390 [bacterium]|nr:hypothetical protein [bacterium]
MIEIKELLGRLSEILLKEEGKTEVLRKVIQEVVGVKINPEDLKIKNHTIFLNIKPIYKNEIYMKQEEIFLKLENLLMKKIPKKIR